MNDGDSSNYSVEKVPGKTHNQFLIQHSSISARRRLAMMPKASILNINTSPTSSSPAASTRPKLGFSIDSLVGLSEASKPPKATKQSRHSAQHIKSLKDQGDSNVAAEYRRDEVRNEFRGEFRTNLFNNDEVMQHQMENIQQALYHINRNKRNNQHLSSPSSSSPSPSPPSKEPNSPHPHTKKGLGSPRRRTPPTSPSILQRTLNNSGFHRPTFSPPVVSSPMPSRSPTLSSPILCSGASTLRIPEPIHPLNSSPLTLSLPNTLTNHLSNPLSNPLNFPPFGLPLAALLPQIRPGYPHPSLAQNISSAQELHNSLSSSEPTSLPSSSLSCLTSSGVTVATTSGLHHSHPNGLMSNPLLANGFPSSAHSGLIQTALPASWGQTSPGFNTGPLGPSLMGPHGLGTPLPPANLPRQYPVYPWLLTRHNRLFGHRFPGPDFPTFLLPFRKPKRIRTAFSPSQLLKLEQAFEKNQYVVGQERKQLAQTLNLSETQVKVWFQNRRTKHKRVVHDGEDGEDGHQGPHDDDVDDEEDVGHDRPEAESTSGSRRHRNDSKTSTRNRQTIIGDADDGEDDEDEDDSIVDSSVGIDRQDDRVVFQHDSSVGSSMMEETTGREGFDPSMRSMSPSSTITSIPNESLPLGRLPRAESRRSRSPMEVEHPRGVPEVRGRNDKPDDLGLAVSSLMNPVQNHPYRASPILKHSVGGFSSNTPINDVTTPDINSASQTRECYSPVIGAEHLILKNRNLSEHNRNMSEHNRNMSEHNRNLSEHSRNMSEHANSGKASLGLTIQRMTHCSSGN
ncbi:uncharacterized protein LOC108672135 [Hyalella azteca]|uniref:Uncharacterized protein LOC108672135 n=1 Tax=Hyalella azteca TaxID=294128 RepID=A0A8B7NNL0_HYAAZ|nr:uncharacterized protein LOC108672135 [Hyalella azteca]